MTNFGHSLLDHFHSAWPAQDWCDTNVLIAVSAGPDSVALLRAAIDLKAQAGGRGELFVAHLNHRLRGSDADTDQQWLQDLCHAWNVSLDVGTADVAQLAAQRGHGLEAAGRDARYDFLRRTAERRGARFVATAHHRDDQVETILHRILRGTGLTGLSGIPFTRPLATSVSLVRPLLRVARRDILDYLAAIGQPFRADPSNSDLQFTRNRLRHELLPQLRKYYNTDVDEALLRLAARAEESQRIISALAAQLAERTVLVEKPTSAAEDSTAQAPQFRVECPPLRSHDALLVREVCRIAWVQSGWPLQNMGFDEWQQLATLARGNTGSPPTNLPGNIQAKRELDYLYVRRIDFA